MSRCRHRLLGLLLVSALSGCGEPWEPEPLDRVCEDVGFSIAAVAFECTASEEDSQAAFDAFEERFRCRIADIHGQVEPDDSNGKYTWANGVPLEAYYTCPAVVGDIDCEAYDTYAAKDFLGLPEWLELAPACGTILEHADGERLSLEEP